MSSLRLILFCLCLGSSAFSADPETLPIPEPGPGFGRRLEIVHDAGLGPTMDVAVVESRLYAIGGGKLTIFDLKDAARPRARGAITGLGNTRQIAVQGRFAYVTAREDGLFVLDVSNPEQPTIVCNYDCLELATGIAVEGPLLVVANRFAGIDLVDASDPAHPTHLSTIRVGEAQSVAVRGGWIYAGAWATREFVIIDARDPRQPVVVGRHAMQGYGDGVAVRGSLAYLATGHHAPGRSAVLKPDAPEFGGGHGFEIVDISDPAAPRLVSRVAFPRAYRIRMDMWSVRLAGRHAFVADTYNGMFVVDIADPARPAVVAHRQLASPNSGSDPSPVAGVALAKDHVYLAGGASDLHVVEARGLANSSEREASDPIQIPPSVPAVADPRYSVYPTGSQVHAVMPWSVAGAAANLMVAAGAAGLHVVKDQGGLNRIAAYPTRGIAMDVAWHDDRVYVAEGAAGLSCWRSDEAGALRLVDRYVPASGASVRQVVLSRDGRHALLATGSSRLEIVRLDAAPMRPVLVDQKPGLFYRTPISPLSADGRFLVQWHRSGLHEYRAGGDGEPAYVAPVHPFPMSTQGGAAPLAEGWLATKNGGYLLLQRGHAGRSSEAEIVRVEGRRIEGKPSVFGDVLFVSSPFTGDVTAIDIGAATRPRLLGHLALPEHNGRVYARGDVAYVPAGYLGLVAWRFRKSTSLQPLGAAQHETPDKS